MNFYALIGFMSAIKPSGHETHCCMEHLIFVVVLLPCYPRFNQVYKQRHENMNGAYLEGPDFIFLHQFFELECKVPITLVENVEKFF